MGMSQDYEGWSVRTRPAVIGLAGFVAGLVLLIVATGLFYNHSYAERMRAIPMRFPAPVLETVQTAPKDKVEPGPPQPPAGIGRAMAQTAAQGDALWGHP
jgi:hypothetical protein